MNVKTHDRIRTRTLVYYLDQVRKKIKETQGSGKNFDIEQKVKLNGVKENKYTNEVKKKRKKILFLLNSALIWHLWQKLEIQGDYFQKKNNFFY